MQKVDSGSSGAISPAGRTKPFDDNSDTAYGMIFGKLLQGHPGLPEAIGSAAFLAYEMRMSVGMLFCGTIRAAQGVFYRITVGVYGVYDTVFFKSFKGAVYRGLIYGIQ